MPFDASPTDNLADIDRSKPLSVRSIKRIVVATRAAGLLAVDHAGKLGHYTIDACPYLTPHGAVDAFLGTKNRSSCPCNLEGRSRDYLFRLNNAHRTALFYRAVLNSNPDDPPHPSLLENFERMLAN